MDNTLKQERVGSRRDSARYNGGSAKEAGSVLIKGAEREKFPRGFLARVTAVTRFSSRYPGLRRAGRSAPPRHIYASHPRDAHNDGGASTYTRSARVTYAVLVHMYICSRVPTRCTALGRTARQNSARPYYLRFVSWLQTITHFPGSSHLSPFPGMALYHPHSPRPSLSLAPHHLPSPSLLPSPSPPSSPFYLFICTASLSPCSLSLSPSRLLSSLSTYGHARTMQRSNGFRY